MALTEILTFAIRVAAVAAIVIVTRWLLRANGAQLPKTRGDARIYGIKWQIRVLGLAVAAALAVMIVAFRHDLISGRDRQLLPIPIGFFLLSLLMAIGSVSTNQSGITKRFFLFSRSLRWDEITEIRFYAKQHHIELRAGSRKLKIDPRFVAVKHLLAEIVDRTRLSPITK